MIFKNNFLKFLCLSLFFLFVFSFVLPASASDVLGTDFVSDEINLSAKDPRTMAAGIINVVLSILGIIAVSIVIYGGFIWMNSEGNEEKVQKAKDILKMGVIGLTIILSAWGITVFVLKKLGASTGSIYSVCQDGDTRPCGGGGISTCIDGVWGPCIGSNIPPGESGSWCSSALGICQPDNSLCNPGLFCNNSCICKYEGLGEPCGQVDLEGVCNNEAPPACSNPALVCGEECLCIAPDDDYNISELGEICDSTDGEGVLGVCATTKVCNPRHALVCEDCECVGNPVITGFSPVGGFCQENLNKACTSDTDCSSGVCNKTSPNSSAGNFITIFGYNFNDNSDGSSKITFVSANNENKRFDGTPPSELNANCGNTWSNTQVIIAFPEGFDLLEEVFVELTTKDGKIDKSNDDIGPALDNIIVNSIKRPGLCRINPIEAKTNQGVLYYGVNLLQNKVYFGNQVNNISAFTPNIFVDNFEGEAIVPGLNTGNTSTFTKEEEQKVLSNFLDFKKLPEAPKGPSISFFDPKIGRAGQYVSIYGSEFGKTRNLSEVSFYNGEDDIPANFSFPAVCMHSVWQNNQIIVKVPDDINYDKPNYQIKVTIGTWDPILSDDFFVASSTADLLPSLCKISPNFGPAGVTNVSFWGEYFKEDGKHTRAVFNINKQSGNLVVSNEGGAQKVSALVPVDAVTGPARISRGGLEGNGINFNVGICSRDSDCPAGNICCGPNTNFPGSCFVNSVDCFEPNKSSSVFEWEFISGFNTDKPESGDNIFSCATYNFCPESYACPNSPGVCSNYNQDGTMIVEGGVCSSNCSSFSYCGPNGENCEYLENQDKCILRDSVCTKDFSYSLEIGEGVFKDYDKIGTCKKYNIANIGERSFYEISVETGCPVIDGVQWTMISPGKCVDTSSLEAPSTCEVCPSGSVCSSGACISPKLCPLGFSCGDNKCFKFDSYSCDCCCSISSNDGPNGPNPDCCHPLTCSYKCGVSANEQTTNDDYGWCSGCNVGSDTAVNDAACNCFDTSGKYCKIDSQYERGICVDCTSLSEDACKEHSSVCCFDAVNNVCRGGAGDESVWGVNISGTFSDSRDQKQYEWVQIGTQIWMAENLNYDDGCFSVSYIPSSDVGWCGYYDNNKEEYEKYGMLYQWSAAMDGSEDEGIQGICPPGWHLPTEGEWNTLLNYLENDQGEKLKASPNDTPSWDGSNEFGFKALPAGVSSFIGFEGFGSLSVFRSSSNAISFKLLNETSFVDGDRWVEESAHSVRCIKDGTYPLPSLDNIGYCPYYNCDSELLTVCNTREPQKEGEYKDVPSCDDGCRANCGLFTTERSCMFDSKCCWDIGGSEGAVCSAGDRFEDGQNAGYCKRYDCASDGRTCASAYPNLTGKYLNLNTCHKECVLKSVGFGESCLNSDEITCKDTCNPLACLNEDGVMGTSPVCGVCCCDPDATEDVCETINEKLSCYKDIDKCSGDNRGLCCGCEADIDCVKAGLVPSEVGCASDTCCKARPEVVGTTPENQQEDVCHNAAIEVNFSKRMNATTFAGNVLLLEESSTPCSPGTQFISSSESLNFRQKVKNIFIKAVNFIAVKMGKEALATASADKIYCSVLGVVDFRNNADKTTSLIFKPNSLLKEGTRYFLVVKGDEDLNSESGVIDFDGIGLNGKGYLDNGSWYNGDHFLMKFNNINFPNAHIVSFKTIDEPADKGGICEVQKIIISPRSYLFQRNDNDLQEVDNDSTHRTFDSISDHDKAFYSYAFSEDDQMLRPVAGYSWTWDWRFLRNDVLEFKNVVGWSNAGDRRLVSVKTGVSDSQDFVEAKIKMDSTNLIDAGHDLLARSNVYVFVCRNPWPAVKPDGTWAPWRDTPAYGNYNYEFHYCRDSGSDLTSDDLPAFLSNLAVIKGASPVQICSNEPSKVCSNSSECDSNGICISSFLKETYFFKERIPRFITDVSVSDLKTGGALKVNWQSEKALVHNYKLYYRERGSASFQERLISKDDCQDTGDNYVCSYNLEGLLNNTAYEIRITALSENMAETELSLSFYGTPTDSNYKSPPLNVSFEIISNKDKKVIIRWEAPTNYEVSNYKVYRGVNSGVYGANFVTQGDETEVTVSLANTENDTFYFVVSSINPIGIESSYSNEIIVPFTGEDIPVSINSGTFIDPRDSQEYKWVKIGDQTWMAENLNYDNGCSSVEWENGVATGWCGYYGNDHANWAHYGLLYQWEVLMDGSTDEGVQGICPPGWHVPAESEWDTLFDYLGDNQGKKLKASPPTWNGDNDYGFNIFPGGFRIDYNGSFIGTPSRYWTSSRISWSSDPYSRAVEFDDGDDFEKNTLNWISALPVRCVK